MSKTKIPDLSAVELNSALLSTVQFVIFDENDPTQAPRGSTKKVLGEDLALAIWGLSGDYIENVDLTFVQSNSANWNSTYTTVELNSATWGTGSAEITGGSTNQVLTKNSSTDSDYSWKNKRTILTLSNLTATGTISSNALSADQFVVTVSGASTSATIGAPSNPYDAQIIMWNIRYASNIAGVSLHSSFRTPITTLNWTISSGRMDIMAAKYNLLDSKWDVISFAPGYII